MSEDNHNQGEAVQQPPPLPELVEQSLGTRLFNILVSPSETFAAVRIGPASTGNWLVPTLLACLMGIIFSFVIFSQPAVIQQLVDKRDAQFQKMVDQGKINKEQAEQMSEESNKFMGPKFMSLFGSVGAVITSFAWVFFLALLLWILGHYILSGHIDYLQALEVTGLAYMVNLVNTLVTMFLVVAKGKMEASLGPSLFMGEVNPTDKVAFFLASINVLTLWYLAILVIGIAEVAGVSKARVGAWIFGAWLVLKVFFGFMGWGG